MRLRTCRLRVVSSREPLQAMLLRILITLVAPLLIISSGCESRSRTNPFDPRNPDTGGEPRLLVAVAGHSEVALTWDLEMFADVRSVRILRASPDEPAQSVLEQQGPGAGRHIDTQVVNGETYTYRLDVAGPGAELLQTASSVATPGASRPWVGDASGRGAARLSPDGRHVVQRIGTFRELLDLKFGLDGSFWAADYRNGAVLRYDRDGELLREWRYYGVTTLAVDRKLALVWAGSFLSRTLTLFSSSGEIVWADSTLGLIEQIEASPAGGGVWVASRSTGVSRVLLRDVVYNFPDFTWPVAVRPAADGGVWVVDRGDPSVSLITPVGPDSMLIRRARAQLIGPRDGAVDRLGGLWVADPDRGGVLYIDGDLEERFFLPLGRVSSVTRDAPGGRLWVAFADEGRVAVLERAGDEGATAGDAGRTDAAAVPAAGAGTDGWVITAEVAVGGRPAIIAGWW